MSSLTGRHVAHVAALAATWATIGVHVDLANDHLVERTYIGVLFLVGAVSLVPTVHGLVRGVSVPAVGWGAAVNVGMATAFVASRTTGLPGGFHEAWTSDGGLGIVALCAEAVFLGAAVMLLAPAVGGSSRALHRRFLLDHVQGERRRVTFPSRGRAPHRLDASLDGEKGGSVLRSGALDAADAVRCGQVERGCARTAKGGEAAFRTVLLPLWRRPARQGRGCRPAGGVAQGEVTNAQQGSQSRASTRPICGCFRRNVGD